MTTYQIFLNLSKELIDLIKNLEIDLKNKLPQIANQEQQPKTPNNTLGYRIKENLKSFWNKLTKPSLKEYCEYLETIDQLSDEIIIEHFGNIMVEQFDLISPIIDKFKIDFSKTLLKYQNIVRSTSDAQEVEEIKKTGAPDTIDPGHVEQLSDQITKIKPIIIKSIQNILNTNVQIEEINPSDFEKGQVKPESFGKVLEYLIRKNIDVRNETEIANELKGYSYTGNFASLLNHAYSSKHEIDDLIFEIENKNKIIPGGVDKVAAKITEIIEGKNIQEIEQFMKEIMQSIKDEASSNDAINAISSAPDEHVTDEQRVLFSILVSPDKDLYVEKIYDIIKNKVEEKISATGAE
jgi:hypothetical protein